MKIVFFVSALTLGSVSAFAPAAISSSPTFMRASHMKMSEAETVDAPPAPTASSEPGGKIVPIKEETVQFTAGLVGGVAGFAVGGPVIGALGAALANYASKNDDEIGEVVSAVSKTSIEVYNYLSRLDDKYELLSKAKGSLETALNKVKSADNVDPETVTKVESALSSTSSKIKEINEEYDLVGAGQTALGVIGDLVEKAIKKAGELNEEYKLTDKATDALSGAITKAKEVKV